MLEKKIAELEARPLERIIKKMTADLENFGCMLTSTGNDYFIQKVHETYDKYNIER